MLTTHTHLLELAGAMADAARAVVGGPHVTIGSVSAANVWNMTELCNRLREAVDEYDRAIVAAAREGLGEPPRHRRVRRG